MCFFEYTFISQTLAGAWLQIDRGIRETALAGIRSLALALGKRQLWCARCCLTGFHGESRKRTKEQCEHLGLSYSGDLVLGVSDILLCGEGVNLSNEKVVVARLWQLPIGADCLVVYVVIPICKL